MYVYTYTSTYTYTYIYMYMYIHMNIYKNLYDIHILTNIYMCCVRVSECVFINRYIYVCVHIYIYIYIYIHICAHIFTHTRTNTHAHIYLHIYTHHTHIHTRTYILTYIYAHTSIHAHTHIYYSIFAESRSRIDVADDKEKRRDAAAPMQFLYTYVHMCERVGRPPVYDSKCICIWTCKYVHRYMCMRVFI